MLIHQHTHTVDVRREELFRIAKSRAHTRSGSRVFYGETEDTTAHMNLDRGKLSGIWPDSNL